MLNNYWRRIFFKRLSDITLVRGQSLFMLGRGAEEKMDLLEKKRKKKTIRTKWGVLGSHSGFLDGH